MTSIKDIARLAGVSASTVSRVVNGRRYVGPDSADRSMLLRRTFTVGLVLPDGIIMIHVDEESVAGWRAAFEDAGLAIDGRYAVSAPSCSAEGGLEGMRTQLSRNCDLSAFLSPGLTTVRQPIPEMGRRTAELMSRLIEVEDSGLGPAPFGHELVVRESTAAPR